jgi:signal transduction histidine kinase/CheY-like chemotaxis protein
MNLSPPPSDDLESVVTTAELSRRASRPPDYAAEARILATLVQVMADSPRTILQGLAEAALVSCGAGSAGVSLIEPDGKHFRWHALAGALSPHLGGTTPRSFSPCGTVVERNSVQLFSYPERHFKYFAEVKPVIVEALLIPFAFDGRPAGTIWVVTHDEQRRFDAEDARLIDNLGRFAAVAYRLRSSLDEARNSDRRKDQLLGIVSHELRNPLLPMQLVVDLLAEKQAGPEDVRHATGVMRRQLAHLRHLVDDLMDVALISRGRLRLRKERIALSDVVECALEISRPVIDSAGHALAVTLPEAPVFVDGDPIRLAQVIGNILNNAAKFTRRGGSLRVSAEARGADAVIRVQDDGIGIEADQLSGIFELYAQVPTSDPVLVEGMGIGLALARSLVEMHGGTIVAHSAGPGQGSEFEIRLPLSVYTAQASVAEASPMDQAGRLRVLVVDDHPDTADSIAWVLHKIGHEARAVYDGPAAIRAVEELPPDVILQDLMLPGSSGFEIAREIRKRPAAERVFLVAITGAAQAASLRASVREAFDHLIVKPVGLRQLKEALGRASAHRAAAI